MNESVAIPLSKPVDAHGRRLTVLTLRPPIGKDIRLMGYPFSIADDLHTKMQPAEGAALIAHLANIPPESVDELSAPDFNACMAALVNFFLIESPSIITESDEQRDDERAQSLIEEEASAIHRFRN